MKRVFLSVLLVFTMLTVMSFEGTPVKHNIKFNVKDVTTEVPVQCSGSGSCYCWYYHTDHYVWNTQTQSWEWQSSSNSGTYTFCMGK